MNKTNIETFTVIGIAVRTTNKNGQSAKDIGALWNKFMSEDILSQIPNKIDNTIYSIYTEYEGDYTQPYTTILGCKVKSKDGMTATFAHVPHDVLETISRRIINEVDGINRVVYDISSKPPATIEI